MTISHGLEIEANGTQIKRIHMIVFQVMHIFCIQGGVQYTCMVCIAKLTSFLCPYCSHTYKIHGPQGTKNTLL